MDFVLKQYDYIYYINRRVFKSSELPISMKYQEIFQKVLEKIKPSAQDLKKINSIMADISKKIDSELKSQKIIAELFIGGSTAKGTFLKNNFDIDCFVRFDPKYSDDEISDLLETILKNIFETIERVHGSRDYFQITYDNYLLEIVPVMKTDDPTNIRNVTDMSPLHVTFVVNALKNNNLQDDIRLAKQFCKSIRVYGAESYIQGFSGHVLDLLIIHYGGFINLLKAASEWNDQIIIDLENHHEDPLKVLNDSKVYSPLIVVDPVQPYRNAAAALSKKKFIQFKKAAKVFLEKPSLAFFTIRHLVPNKIVEVAKKIILSESALTKRLVILEVNALDGKKDVVGAKIMKVFDHLKKAIKINGFNLLVGDWEYFHKQKKAILFFIVKESSLSETFEKMGPPIKQKTDVDKFKEKHSKFEERNGRLYATITREHTTLNSLIKALIKLDYVSERVKGVAMLKLKSL